MEQQEIITEIEEPRQIKKVFREIYYDEFEDPSEELADSLYDLIPPEIISNEMKKIKGVKEKHGKLYFVEKVNKGTKRKVKVEENSGNNY